MRRLILDKPVDLVTKSIDLYRSTIFNDIRSTLRIINLDTTFYTTKLVDWKKDQISFFAPIFQEDFISYSVGTLLNVQFTTESGLFQTSLKILKTIRRESQICYIAQIITPIIKTQLREHVRINALFTIYFTTLPDKNKNSHHIEATGVNISAGGLRMVCASQLNKESSLQMTFNLFGYSFSLTGVIVKLTGPHKTGLYTYHIKFTNMPDKTRNSMERLISERQRLKSSCFK